MLRFDMLLHHQQTSATHTPDLQNISRAHFFFIAAVGLPVAFSFLVVMSDHAYDQMLELDIIGDRLIGSDEEGGLSLEQRKRTTLGVELAANPSLVFLGVTTTAAVASNPSVRCGLSVPWSTPSTLRLNTFRSGHTCFIAVGYVMFGVSML